MNKLKVIGFNDPKYWRSFRAALSEVWQSSESGEYRIRIADRQRTMTLLLCALSLETRVFEKEVQVLTKLNYMDRPTRHEKITDTHFTTSKWSLAKIEQTEAKYGKLRHWLRDDNTLFGVSEKPGSGNSTFATCIANSEETKKCLETWAGTRDLFVVGHYFTIYGVPIQQSLEALLRSLLFGISAQKPALIPKLMPDLWERS
ncbi:hypothetical protein CORC01_10100 [Colletotrichum orchidophilum]|uniref:Nephrocystin 3-like N-terminal domain-containing protein n=1 Tax=Colletotrichum orchidophilum TaxID=1209926 RepID=A0A1G4AZU2_9PEZI|nr:uncharacterized protein CORC01_10100 [Colletotrichum orchidophilum]OHE94572.1 hypothetical protein CORC01_10100 [Colletotrichum orchidophilum]